MSFLGPWEFALGIALIMFLIPASIVSWHSGKYNVKNRWLWILIALVLSWLGLVIYLVVSTMSRPARSVEPMASCPKCGNSLPADSKFCNKCGYAFSEEICSKCGASNPPDSVYCRKCGFELKLKCRYCGARMDRSGSFCSVCRKAQE